MVVIFQISTQEEIHFITLNLINENRHMTEGCQVSQEKNNRPIHYWFRLLAIPALLNLKIADW